MEAEAVEVLEAVVVEEPLLRRCSTRYSVTLSLSLTLALNLTLALPVPLTLR